MHCKDLLIEWPSCFVGDFCKEKIKLLQNDPMVGREESMKDNCLRKTSILSFRVGSCANH